LAHTDLVDQSLNNTIDLVCYVHNWISIMLVVLQEFPPLRTAEAKKFDFDFLWAEMRLCQLKHISEKCLIDWSFQLLSMPLHTSNPALGVSHYGFNQPVFSNRGDSETLTQAVYALPMR